MSKRIQEIKDQLNKDKLVTANVNKDKPILFIKNSKEQINRELKLTKLNMKEQQENLIVEDLDTTKVTEKVKK